MSARRDTKGRSATPPGTWLDIDDVSNEPEAASKNANVNRLAE